MKKRFPDKENREGIYRRIEEETVITSAQEKDLMEGRPINAFPYRLIDYVAPKAGVIRPRVIVKNDRRILHIRDADYQKAELCFDRVFYRIDGKDLGPFFEIEIESRSAADDHVARLAGFLEANLDLSVCRQTKYERGVELVNRSERSV